MRPPLPAKRFRDLERVFSVRLPVDLSDRIDVLKAKCETTNSEVFRVALTYYLDQLTEGNQ